MQEWTGAWFSSRSALPCRCLLIRIHRAVRKPTDRACTGHGVNAYFTYDVVKGVGLSWETAFGAVFLLGLLCLIVSLAPIREWGVNQIPLALKTGITAGIRFFPALIWLKNARNIAGSPATLVTICNLKSACEVLAGVDFIVIVILDARKFPGAIRGEPLATSAAATLSGLNKITSMVSLPPSIAPVLLKAGIAAIHETEIMAIVLTFFFVDVFDNIGNLIGVAGEAGHVAKNRKLSRIGKALRVASSTGMAGADLGYRRQRVISRVPTT